MIRINLIPPEITQKRKTESRVLLMLTIFIVIMAVMGVFAAFMFVRVGSKNDEVAAAQQELENVLLQAETFKVFEDKQRDLDDRVEIAEEALLGRVDWSRLCEEVSLVLPEDVWLQQFNADEQNGVTFVGMALDYQDDFPDSGHKTIARTLVRLTDLEQLFNVWLTASVKAGLQDDFEESWLDFNITASVEEPVPETESDTAAEGDPAPPAESP